MQNSVITPFVLFPPFHYTPIVGTHNRVSIPLFDILVVRFFSSLFVANYSRSETHTVVLVPVLPVLLLVRNAMWLGKPLNY
jgi:hypothetical protein